MPIDPPQVDEQIAMLQEWYREVIKESEYLEATNCDQFLTVQMPLRPVDILKRA